MRRIVTNDSIFAAEKAALTEKEDLETHIKCIPYYYLNETYTPLPESSAAKYEVMYAGKKEE